MNPTAEVVPTQCVVSGRVDMQVHKCDTSRHEPTAAFILHQLGVIAYNGKKIDVALTFMSMACAQPEAPALCHRNYAEMLHRCGQSERAEAAARLAVQRDSSCVDAWDTLGTILFANGALAESRDCYQTAVQIKPDFFPALNNLAVVLQKLGQFDESEFYYRSALSLQSDNLEIQLNFGNLLMELKRYREALEVAKRIIDGCPKDTELRRIALELKRKLVRDVSGQNGAGRILRAFKPGESKIRLPNIQTRTRRSNRSS